MLGVALCCFHRVDELSNVFSIVEESLHDLWDIHRVDSVKTRTKLGEMVQEFAGHDIGVEGVRVFELLLPCFVNNGDNGVSASFIGRLMELTVISS